MAKAKRKATMAKRATKKPAKRAAARTAGRKGGSDEAAMMAAWQKAMTPSDGHRRLEPIVGTWNAKTTFWMKPGTPPQVSEGKSEHRWVLDGRYVEQVYRGSSMGMPFEGRGFTGYDNVQGKYVGTWMDSFGTGIMESQSTGKPSGKAISFATTSFEPGTGRKLAWDTSIRIQDRNRHTYEMWLKQPGGKRFRTMLVEYRRSGS